MLRLAQTEYDTVAERCLKAYLEAGTPELSLDRLGIEVGVSRRMLVHYFGSREAVEERAISLFEERLRLQFGVEVFPSSLSLQEVVLRLWEQVTATEFKSHLRLTFNLYCRAWEGLSYAQTFYSEHRRIWFELLGRYTQDDARVQALLLLLQGAAMGFLVTGNPEPGKLALERAAAG